MMELVMSQSTDNFGPIDRKTSRSVCEGIGERLQRNLKPVTSELPARLERLLEELRLRERQTGTKSN